MFCCGPKRVKTALSSYIPVKLCRVWGSHSSGYEDLYLLGHNAV
jgi:hypothetical protein